LRVGQILGGFLFSFDILELDPSPRLGPWKT
jgi:hypothetical protein